MLRAAAGGVTLAVRVQPGAKKTAIIGIFGDGPTAQLKISVQAPPLEGRANSALISFLADTLDLPKNNIELVAGELSKSKVLMLHGVTAESISAKLSQWMQLSGAIASDVILSGAQSSRRT
jgi:uncharacterized protein (TIGR00251 family)